MSEFVYYVNGSFVPAAQAVLPLNDLGIVRGYAVFDLLRTYGRVPFRLGDHVARLQRSAATIGLDLPWSAPELEAFIGATYARNPDLGDASLRIIVTGGPSADYMTPQQRPSLIIMVHPIKPYSERLYREGAAVVTTDIERAMPTVKSINYSGAVKAVVEAERLGAVEAIYRDTKDRITEGTRSNLFLVRNGTLYTAAEGVLLGITRQVVLEVVEGHIPVRLGPLTYADLVGADEAFVTSTTKELLPVVEVDGQLIGTGRPGAVTAKAHTLFRAYVAEVTAAVPA
jgi:branched-chain amino acid aminotransferase